jgi:hypothetical protein
VGVGRVKEKTIKGLFVKMFNQIDQNLLKDYKAKLEREKIDNERIGKLDEDIERLIKQERALFLIEGYAGHNLVKAEHEELEQLSSYQAQVEHYTSYIQNNPAWEFCGIFADEGISGTNTKKRVEFNRMIEDCMAGKIDMVITKSISRFARNSASRKR